MLISRGVLHTEVKMVSHKVATQEYLPRATRLFLGKFRACLHWGGRPPGRWGNPLRWGNLPVHIISHFNLVIDGRVTPPKWGSPTWGPAPPCKQPLNSHCIDLFFHGDKRQMTESHAKKAQTGSLRYSQDLTKHAHTLFTPLRHNNDRGLPSSHPIKTW